MKILCEANIQLTLSYHPYNIECHLGCHLDFHLTLAEHQVWMHHNIYFNKNGLCLSIYGWQSTHYYGSHELQECSELHWITFESSSIQLQAHFVFTKGLCMRCTWFFFGFHKVAKNLQKQKDTAGTPFLYKISICKTVSGNLFPLQDINLWNSIGSFEVLIDPWFTVLDVNVFKFDARK
jgi:hypothetical protein